MDDPMSYKNLSISEKPENLINLVFTGNDSAHSTRKKSSLKKNVL